MRLPSRDGFAEQAPWHPVRRAAIASYALLLFLFMCVNARAVAQDATKPGPPLDGLGRELRKIILEELREDRSEDAAEKSRNDSRDFQERAGEFVRGVRDRLRARLEAAIEREFGPPPPVERERVALEARDSEGRPVDLQLDVVARPLRRIDIPAYESRAFSVLETDGLALALYDTLPGAVEAAESEAFRRVYTGEDADALAAEAKLIVGLKGGEWRLPEGEAPVANVIAVRGLDFEAGLHTNGSETYDDTMFVVVELPGGGNEVYEYRMTTESSSTDKGVGRLSAMQVYYVRGLHRGRDPGYRLKGDAADGTRQGLEGTHRILGANVHSAYSKSPIDSRTPLKENVSLGCQVVAASKKDFETTLVAVLDKMRVREFPYTIVEGDELAVLERALTDRGKHSLLVAGVSRGGGKT